MDKMWPLFSSKFSLHRTLKHQLVNAEVSLRRREFERKNKQKKRAGNASAELREQLKSKEVNEIGNIRSSEKNLCCDINETKRNETKNSKTKRSDERVGASSHSAGDMEIVRKTLEAYMEPLGFGAPDGRIVLETLDAGAGVSALEINRYLVERFEQQPPGKTGGPKGWGWFPTVVRGRFANGD